MRNGICRYSSKPKLSLTPRDKTKQGRCHPAGVQLMLSAERPPSHAGQHTDEVLAEWGFDQARIAKLRETGATS